MIVVIEDRIMEAIEMIDATDTGKCSSYICWLETWPLITR